MIRLTPKQRKKLIKPRSWAEHEALIGATERAERLRTIAIRNGQFANLHCIQTQCDRKALETLRSFK